jgi:peptidyl-prolyl cis-trans isomerase SurA
MKRHLFRSGRAAATMVIAAAFATTLLPRTLRAQEVTDRVVASVDGDPITTHDLKDFAAMNRVSLADPSDLTSPETKAVLKGAITERLLEREVKKYQGQVDDHQVDEYIANFEQSAGINDEQLRAQLQAQGHTYEEFRKHSRHEIEQMMMIDKEVRAKINVSPDEIKAYYDAHPAEFTVKQERFKIAQILIAVPPNASPADVEAARKKADDICKQLKKGGDFAALARQYSDDDSKSQGGELGNFSRGEILDPIQAAVDHMKVGDISQPVRTDHGFHILKLEEHDTPGVKPLNEASEQIRNKLASEKAKQQFATWVDTELVRQHDVETLY